MTRYLLDTCTWIFLLTGDIKLKKQQQQIIIDPQNTIYISVVSVWEMAIKIEKGKLKLPKPLQELIFEACVKDNFKILNLDVFSVLNTKNLPDYHQDPFDRILISQAIDNDLIIITSDSKFFQYEVKILNY
jgi:PIN domain nuclease of toxin-antitoxin system